MKNNYAKVITDSREIDGSLLDAMHAVQKIDGYLTEDAILALSEEFESNPTQVYECASFYGMLRFAPPCRVAIQICRNASCHVAGASEVIRAFEDILRISMGETTPDGFYSLEYSECIGQCQSSPTVVINENIYTNMTPDKVREIIKKMEDDR